MIDRKVTRYFDDRFIEFNALVIEIPCDDMPMNNVGGQEARMHYYLIDYENVGVAGLTGLDLPGEDSEIRVFLSDAAHLATEEVKQDAIASKAVIDTFYCTTAGKNAMDFQIAAYAGALLERPDTTRISIVSEDQGYSAVWDYGRKVRKSIPIYLGKSILEAYAAYEAGFAKRGYSSGKKPTMNYHE